MWNYYLRNGNYQGYNIGIKIHDFLKHFDYEETGDTVDPFVFYCGEVLYSPKKQEKEIEALCKSIEEIAKEEQDEFKLRFGMAFLWTYIESYGLFFKDESFSDEKEYRIVIRYFPFSPMPITEYFKLYKDESGFEYSFFERGGILVPCLKVPLSKGAVKQVTMAPMLESHIASESIMDFLNTNSYSEVEVRQSAIPIRY